MNGHWTGQALITTEIHFTGVTYIVTLQYRSENSRLNTVFTVGLHSVHKRVFNVANGTSKCRAWVTVVTH